MHTPPAIDSSPLGPHADLPRSLEVKRDHTLVRLDPTKRAKRRGVVMSGARLPALNTATGPGCKSAWYKVHTDAWICGDRVRVSRQAPGGRRYPVVPSGELTPWPYGFVREPAIEYRTRRGVLEEVREVVKGFGFGVQSVVTLSEKRFFHTAEGTLIPREAAGITSRISKFAGIELSNGRPWPVGFVNSKTAFAFTEPTRDKEYRIGKVERYTPFAVLRESGQGRRRFVMFDRAAWLPASDVRIATLADPPADIEPGERWIDVDTRQQILTAYQGRTPVYVTLVSTGRFGSESSRTVKGEFRIWAKVAAIAMDNTDEQLEAQETDAGVPEEEQRLYSLHDVPWTQFFFESYALHGVYWHDRFGNARSHGCVNLSPADARWIYDWTEPELPDGWWAIHTSTSDEGTLIRVR